MKKQIVITAGALDLVFNVTTDEYHRYVNETTMDNKVAPARNFLSRTADADSKQAVEEMCGEGMALDLAALVLQEFKPKIELSVKTLNVGQTA